MDLIIKPISHVREGSIRFPSDQGEGQVLKCVIINRLKINFLLLSSFGSVTGQQNMLYILRF